MQRDYNEYRRVHSCSSESGREANVDGDSSEELLEEMLLWDQATNTEYLTEEGLSSAW